MLHASKKGFEPYPMAMYPPSRSLTYNPRFTTPHGRSKKPYLAYPPWLGRRDLHVQPVLIISSTDVLVRPEVQGRTAQLACGLIVDTPTMNFITVVTRGESPGNINYGCCKVSTSNRIVTQYRNINIKDIFNDITTRQATGL